MPEKTPSVSEEASLLSDLLSSKLNFDDTKSSSTTDNENKNDCQNSISNETSKINDNLEYQNIPIDNNIDEISKSIDSKNYENKQSDPNSYGTKAIANLIKSKKG
ncbi:hypothetical protein AYI70_g6 [Smittium culicis]|uniref:Uncharacterized protein n=1 Tax=Smittium culicis TaxID=133412 RepID=A0A1R1YI86_9FUNG|nr:hypothetical protein AYI70_g6 [Smittium culicis]